MAFTPDLAEIRFGYGLSPGVAAPGSVGQMLEGLTGPDVMAETYPVETFDTFRARMIEARDMRQTMRKHRGTPEFEAKRKEYRKLNARARRAMWGWHGQTLLRRSYTETGFRERLVNFWGDHFTARGKAGVIRRATSPFVEEAVRPYLTGPFSEMLIAAAMHPLMMHYLDQQRSVGPNSPAAAQRRRGVGLNENLAREVLELHTLGVDGPYDQTDVRQLAELFTGMRFRVDAGVRFERRYAEPGAETVLGQTYGGDPADPEAIYEVLRDLASHPATARHIAQKLAVHFVSDTPDPALIEHVAARYAETDGTLIEVYAALLEHPAAWDSPLANVKTPDAFVSSAFRALAVTPEAITGLKEKEHRALLITPMALMGQVWQRPSGPDGWPEEDSAWITPQGMAARVRWAMAAPQRFVPDLPDPRVFVEDALGTRATDAVRFAASAAESKPEAIGVILASPAFQRR